MNAFLAKWGICLLLLAATTLNYLDRQTISILAPTIQREMRLDNEALGWLFAVFYYSYTFAQFGVGLLLDRFSLRWLYGGAVVGWSAACALTGLANGFAALIGFRLLLGIMESANWPGAMRIVARVLPPRERAMGNGIFTSGTSIGALIAPALILAIQAWVGWRMAFVVVGSFGLVWFAGWYLATRSRRYDSVWHAQPGERPPGSTFAAYGEILRQRQFWRVFCVTILVNPCLYFYLNWLPTWLDQEVHLLDKTKLAGVLTGAYLGLDLGYLSSGAAVILLTRRGLSLRGARRAVFLGATALLLCSSVLPWQRELATIVPLLMVVNFALGVWITMYLTMAQEVNPTHVSTAAGLLGGSGSLAGALAMWGVGRVTRLTGSFGGPMMAVSVAAVLAAAAGWAVTRATVSHTVEKSA
jgi:MFS transporter, ACS family, hexuronate transporter